jgi:mediator of RNA polymerase II transcription subunit 20
MKEFMQSFLGPSIPELPSVFATKPEGLYVPADCVDTMTQYLELFSKVRKQQVLPGTTR